MKVAPHPRTPGIMLLTAFLGSVTVPTLNSWIHRKKGRDLGRQQVALEAKLAEGDGGHGIPARWQNRTDPSVWTWSVPSETALRVDRERLFSADHLDLFLEKSKQEGQWKRVLLATSEPTAKVSRDGIELRWAPPANLSELRSQIDDDPLLSLGYRVYRWREGGEPELLATNEVTQSFYRDQSLPLWRQRFFYCVATVLEGRIGELPTLIESQRSPVISVDTLENFSLEILDGGVDSAQVKLSIYQEGQWDSSFRTVQPGDSLRPWSTTPTGEPDVEPRSAAPESSSSWLPGDTGLTVESIDVRSESQQQTVERPEFLPDGRRKIDSAGRPSIRSEVVPVSVSYLELHCLDHEGKQRTFTSSAIPADQP